MKNVFTNVCSPLFKKDLKEEKGLPSASSILIRTERHNSLPPAFLFYCLWKKQTFEIGKPKILWSYLLIRLALV